MKPKITLLILLISCWSGIVKGQSLEMFPPTANAATNHTATSFTGSWNNVEHANYYIVEIAGSNGYFRSFTTTSTSYTFTGLDHNSSYGYRVKFHFNPSTGLGPFGATSGEGFSFYSNIVEAWTSPNIPSGIVNSGSITGFDHLRWQWIQQSNTYIKYDVSTSPNFSSFLPGYHNKVEQGYLTYVENLTNGTTYYIRARFLGNQSDVASGYSGTYSLTTKVPAPVIIDPTIGDIQQNGFTARWESVGESSQGTEYLFSIVNGPSNNTCNVDCNLNVGTSTSYYYMVLDGQQPFTMPGADVYYTVRAKIGHTTSLPTTIKGVPMPSAVPTNLQITYYNEKGLSFFFTENQNTADYYMFDVATSSSFSSSSMVYENEYLGPVPSNNYYKTLPNLQFNKDYWVRIKGANTISGSNLVSYSDVSSSKNFKTRLARPVPTGEYINPGGFTITWAAVPGAIKYSYDIIRLGRHPATIVQNIETTSTQFTHTNLNIVDHIVRVRAISHNNNKTSLATDYTIRVRYDHPSNLRAENITASSAVIRWNHNKVPGFLYSVYTLIVTNTSTQQSTSYTTNDHAYTLNGLSSSQLYEYKVKYRDIRTSSTYESIYATGSFTTSSAGRPMGLAIQAFPNPTTGLVRLSNEVEGEPIEVQEVVNLTTGERIPLEIRLSENNQDINELDLTGLASGLYIVRYQVNGEVLEKRLIKE